MITKNLALVISLIALTMAMFLAFNKAQADNFIDDWATDQLVWNSVETAQRTSDVLQTALILSPLAYAMIEKRDDKLKRVGASVFALGVNSGITALIKWMTHRQRPNFENYKSFPSGHVSSSVTGAMLLCAQSSKQLCTVAMALAAGVGYLRVAGEKHWISDSLAGFALGYVNGKYIPSLVYKF